MTPVAFNVLEIIIIVITIIILIIGYLLATMLTIIGDSTACNLVSNSSKCEEEKCFEETSLVHVGGR